MTNGYGYFSVKTKYHRAHRYLWESLHGSIPEKLVLDHLCGVKNCVNPAHLEVVTQKENLRRVEKKPACPSGHIMSGTNLVFYRGHRNCRECNRLRAQAVRDKKNV